MRRRSLLLPGLLVGVVALRTALAPRRAIGGDIYRFALRSIDGTDMPLEQFRGRALLVVNTASLCGFTDQYAGLQRLWERYRDRGLVVIGVPSGDFNQEYAEEAKIKAFCEVNFDIDFPLTMREHVRGEEAHPLFRFFVAVLGPSAEPRWNFHKVLVDASGRPVATFPTRVEPEDPQVLAAIEQALPAA